MGSKMRKISVLLSALLLAGCGNTFDLTLAPQVTLFMGDSHGPQIQLTQKNEEYRVLEEWLRENRSNWYTTSGRYQGGVYIQSGDYGIQVTNTTVVIYSAQRGEPRAIYIQNIKKSELSSIKNIGKQD